MKTCKNESCSSPVLNTINFVKFETMTVNKWINALLTFSRITVVINTKISEIVSFCWCHLNPEDGYKTSLRNFGTFSPDIMCRIREYIHFELPVG